MTTGKALNGKPYAGNPHVRFDEGEVASAATPRRGSLLYNVNKLITFAAVAASAAVYADTYTDSNDLTWTFTANGTKATLSACSGNNTVSFDAAKIPWTFSKDGQDYIVTAIGNTFKNWTKLTGALSIPDAVTSIGSFEKCYETTLTFGSGVTSIPSYCFKNNDYIKSVIVPATVTSIGQQGFSYLNSLVAVWVKGSATINKDAFIGADVLETALFGLGSKRASGAEIFDTGAYGKAKTVYMPAGTWGGFTTGNTTVTAILYGEGQELDIAIDETAGTLTATPTTEHALTNVLASAANFKQYFGLDTVISITNDIAASVEITTDMLNDVKLNVPTWYMTFAVKTQTQLNRVLAATTGPIVADITGATEEITPPVGRRVAILAPGGATFNYHKRGLMIMFY